MAQKTFIGIGASHIDNVFDFVYGVLSDYQPEAITLEKKMTFCGKDGRCDEWGNRKQAFYELKSKIRYEEVYGTVNIFEWLHGFNGQSAIQHDNVRQIKLFVDDTPVLRGNDLEFNPAVSFALNKKIPFYLIDMPIFGTKDIIEFYQERYNIISLEGKDDLTKNIPAINLEYESGARNLFAADAINFLFKSRFGCIAHIGGTSHFNIQYSLTDKWDPYLPDYKKHIQDYLLADSVIIADSNTQKVHFLL